MILKILFYYYPKNKQHVYACPLNSIIERTDYGLSIDLANIPIIYNKN